MKRKPLPGFGVKGTLGKRGAYVRAFLEKRLVRVQWTEKGRRHTSSWKDTPENRAVASAFALGVDERLRQIAAGATPQQYKPHTVRAIYEAFLLGNTEHMRDTTLTTFQNRWKKFEETVGADKLASSVTRETLDQFRAELKRVGHVPEQIARHVQVVKQVYSFAVDRDLIAPTKVVTYSYKRSRDEKPLVIAEYTPKEAGKLLAGMDPRKPADWRLYVALYLFAFAGPRQKAARHLEWRDVDLTARTVRWRPELDKLGYDRTQPLPEPVIDALYVALGWRQAYGYEGPFILFRPGAGSFDRGGWHDGKSRVSARSMRRASAKPDKPWTYQAFNQALARLETRVGVKHLEYRAAHGFRRYVINNVLAETGGNLVLAGQYVGDKDLRTLARSYIRERDGDMRNVADKLASRNADATESAPADTNEELAHD